MYWKVDSMKQKIIFLIILFYKSIYHTEYCTNIKIWSNIFNFHKKFVLEYSHLIYYKSMKLFYVHGKCIENYCDARKNWWKAKSFLYMYSLKSLIYVYLDPCIPVFNGHDDFFFFFHCIQKQFMERVANFLFSFPLLLFYSNSFRHRVLLPTQLWGKKGIYQQSLFM